MPLSIFRISQVEIHDTRTTEDPFMTVGFYSEGKMGTDQYAKEPVHLLAPQRRNGYPGMRWMLLAAGRQKIAAALHTPEFDFFALGSLSAFELVGPVGSQLCAVTLDVKSVTQNKSGAVWRALQQAGVTNDSQPSEDSLWQDVRKRRGWKLAKRGLDLAEDIWDLARKL